jgi:hypothetical protein
MDDCILLETDTMLVAGLSLVSINCIAKTMEADPSQKLKSPCPPTRCWHSLKCGLLLIALLLHIHIHKVLPISSFRIESWMTSLITACNIATTTR